MKTETISIFADGKGKDEALALTDKTASYSALDHKSALRLRLLSEELIGFIGAFKDNHQGDFWLEADDKDIEIHLMTEIPMDLQTRRELLAVSTSGKNDAAKGFMGKLREMIANATLPNDPEEKEMSDQVLGLMSLGSQFGQYSGNYSWAMTQYTASINNASSKPEVQKEKDDLERSIVANIADDVKVNIINDSVEITIFKSFK